MWRTKRKSFFLCVCMCSIMMMIIIQFIVVDELFQMFQKYSTTTTTAVTQFTNAKSRSPPFSNSFIGFYKKILPGKNWKQNKKSQI